MPDIFDDRLHAGQRLAEALSARGQSHGVVVGLARGGVVVGYALAEALDLPLCALVVRKIGAPHNPELALGAVSETGVQWIDAALVRATGATEQYIESETATQVHEARRRQREYSVGPPGLSVLRDRTAIITDDGIATGASALVAVRSVRDLGAEQVVLAVPVVSEQAKRMLAPVVDELVALSVPEPFLAVGFHYHYFDQVTDAEVVRYLRRAEQRPQIQQ